MFWIERNAGYEEYEEEVGLLDELSPGSVIKQLIIRNVFVTFDKVIFEGMSGQIALFSRGTIPRTGLLRVHKKDIVAIIL